MPEWAAVKLAGLFVWRPALARKASIFVSRIDQEPSLRSQPIADDAGALFAVVRPVLREAVIGDFIGIDAEGITDQLRCVISVVIVDCLFKKVTHRKPSHSYLDRHSKKCSVRSLVESEIFFLVLSILRVPFD
jgi:hypothetical protein